jgi:superfamily II DNA/RNA helicase
MINFDLPWNPMQIEQRLGRIHRIGQEHDVSVINLATAGTIEDRMLSVLERKINLFELVIGELDLILGRVEEDFDFESRLFRLHVEARDESQFSERLEALGDELAHARQAATATRERNDELVGDR